MLCIAVMVSGVSESMTKVLVYGILFSARNQNPKDVSQGRELHIN